MRGSPQGLYFDPHEALVGQTDVQVGRLGHDGGVDPVLGQEIRRADARVLFVRNRGEEYLAAERRARVDQCLDRP